MLKVHLERVITLERVNQKEGTAPHQLVDSRQETNSQVGGVQRNPVEDRKKIQTREKGVEVILSLILKCRISTLKPEMRLPGS